MICAWMKVTVDNKLGINTNTSRIFKKRKKKGRGIWELLAGSGKSGRRIRRESGLEQRNWGGQWCWNGELKADLIPGVQFRKIPEQVLNFGHVNCYWDTENETKPLKSWAELSPDCSAPSLSPSIPYIYHNFPPLCILDLLWTHGCSKGS